MSHDELFPDDDALTTCNNPNTNSFETSPSFAQDSQELDKMFLTPISEGQYEDSIISSSHV